MHAANIFNLGIKELRSLRREPMLIVLIIYAFTVSVHSAATALPETIHKANIAIVDQDRSPLSQRIADAFYLPYFKPPTQITQYDIDKRLDTGSDTFVLVIPPDFQSDVLAGKDPAIQLNIDATRLTQALNGNVYIQSIITGEVNSFLQKHRSNAPPPVDLALRVRFNPELKESWFGGIMELISGITMLSIILTGAALIREREHGTVEHLLVMPVTPFEIMVSKVWSMVLVVLVASSLSLIFIIKGLLLVPIEGSIFLFLIGTALQLFATTSMGIFLATIARSMPQFGLLLILVLVPMQILSGGLAPRESMPEFIQHIMLAAPNTHFVKLAQAILFRSAGFSVVWPEFFSLAFIGTALFSFSLSRFRKTLSLMTSA